jgi:hypothetical protein
VLDFERARLIAADRPRLADRVEQVSLTRGDFEGLDVLSFDTAGAEQLIAVKTTRYGAYTPSGCPAPSTGPASSMPPSTSPASAERGAPPGPPARSAGPAMAIGPGLAEIL